jgi:hypothetical protein
LIFFFLMVLGFELRAPLAEQELYHLSHAPLLGGSSLELRSSGSLPPTQLGLQM